MTGGADRWLRRLSLGGLALAVVVVAAAATFVLFLTPASVPPQYRPKPTGALFIAATLTFAAIGTLITRQQPRNRVGWTMLVVGICVPLGVSNQYVINARYAPASFPAPAIPSLVGTAGWTIALTLIFTLFLYFPDGRLLSSRWRWFSRLAALAFGLVVFGQVLDPRGLDNGPTRVVNPIGIPGASDILQSVFAAGALVMILVVLAGLVSQVLRYRRGSSEVRHQMKWVMLAVPLLAMTGTVSILLNGVLPDAISSLVNGLGYMAVAVSIGIAVLKYRLYDIDLVISRALVYGALAAFISIVYVAIVVGVGTLVGVGGRPNLALSILATAVVAVAFQPVRERLQRIANRLVYGRRATPYEVLSEFSERVAESYAADEVLPRMARALGEGTGARRAAVWLRAGEELAPVAEWEAAGGGGNGAPGASVARDRIRLSGQILPALPEADRAVPVRHQGELLGALTVTMARGESLTPVEEKLLQDLAHQAGLVLKNVGLTADLKARLEDLRESRKRLMAAQDQERCRLERNLHDGAQQNLVAFKLGLAEAVAATDPATARELMSRLRVDADEALESLRDLARGIYPPLLADKGLAAALEAQARKATLPVSVEAVGIGRYPQEVEAAVYFCVLEALRNAQKYAGESRAKVRLEEADGAVSWEVEDDGRGFDPATTRKGSGLQNMGDRLEALGGSLSLRSADGRGATLSGMVPIALAGAAL